jgi:uncharacterized repeat protein (TIGR03803 family)
MRTTPRLSHWLLSSALAVAMTIGGESAVAGEKVVYTFKGGSDGLAPLGPLIADKSGNLYGTTEGGGGGTGCPGDCGTVFELSPQGVETVLYAFAGGCDGGGPRGKLLKDGQGNYFGTTVEGGYCGAPGFGGWGTVFKLAPDGTETVVYAFQGGSDGAGPAGDVIEDNSSNLYGFTFEGGDLNACNGYGCGTVFKVDSAGNESVLYAFHGGSDGLAPSGAPIADGSGNFYGVTSHGGVDCGGVTSGCGVVFKLAPDGTETVLHTFQGGDDGIVPLGSLLMGSSGDLYGTTLAGGAGNDGIVFKLAPDGTESILHAFTGGSDGNGPFAGLIMDKAGNLYGTTFDGGGTGCNSVGCGTVFKLAPNGVETVLARLAGKRGKNPWAALLETNKGLLYGTASGGGINNNGVVFSLKK